MWIFIIYGLLMLPFLEDLRVVMGDEACYIDPALRFTNGQGFTSIAWAQPPDTFWASNFPLHAWLNVPWISLTGADSLFSLRLFSLVFFVAGLLLWTFAAQKAGWFSTRTEEYLFAIFYCVSLYGLGPSQYIRPESIGALLYALAAIAWLQKPGKLRLAAFAGIGLLFSLAGLPNAFALAFAATFWMLYEKLAPWREFLACGIGGALGIALLLALYASQGVLDVFLQSTFLVGSNRWAQWHGWRDPVLLCLNFVLLSGLLLNVWKGKAKTAALFGLVFGLGLPIAFFVVNKYPNYYSFYALLPLTTCAAVCIRSLFQKAKETESPTKKTLFAFAQKFFKYPAILLVFFAGAVSYPLSLILSINTIEQRSHRMLAKWVSENLRGDEVLFVDPAAYFAVRKIVPRHFTQFALSGLDAPSRSQINTLLLWSIPNQENVRRATDLIGGSWEKVAAYDAKSLAKAKFPFLEILSRLSYAGPYQLELWKRTPNSLR